MSEQLKLRGDTATNLAHFTPAQRECVVDITNNRLCVGDGSTANGWPLAKLSEGAWTVSTGVMQCVLSQRTAITSEPVPTLRPTTANTPIALDIMPNGSPGGTGIAWNDICDADVLNNTSTPVNFLHLAANSTTLEVGSASLYGGNRQASDLHVWRHGEIPSERKRAWDWSRQQCLRRAAHGIE